LRPPEELLGLMEASYQLLVGGSAQAPSLSLYVSRAYVSRAPFCCLPSGRVSEIFIVQFHAIYDEVDRKGAPGRFSCGGIYSHYRVPHFVDGFSLFSPPHRCVQFAVSSRFVLTSFCRARTGSVGSRLYVALRILRLTLTASLFTEACEALEFPTARTTLLSYLLLEC
jgi:hypothetical protein